MTNQTIAVPLDLLQRLQYRLDPHKDARDWGMVYDLLAQPADHSEQDLGMVWCDCGDGYPERSFGAGFIAALGHCENCDAANPAEQPSAAQVPPYCEQMGEAAQRYCDGFTLSPRLPATWRWQKLYEAMLAAAPKAPEGREDAFALMREGLRKVSDRLEAFIDDEMDMPHSSMEVCKGICDAALSAAQDKGEVQRLREALRKADDVLAALTACTTPLVRLERKYGKDWCRAIDQIRSELIAASTGQEVKL